MGADAVRREGEKEQARESFDKCVIRALPTIADSVGDDGDCDEGVRREEKSTRDRRKSKKERQRRVSCSPVVEMCYPLTVVATIPDVPPSQHATSLSADAFCAQPPRLVATAVSAIRPLLSIAECARGAFCPCQWGMNTHALRIRRMRSYGGQEDLAGPLPSGG